MVLECFVLRIRQRPLGCFDPTVRNYSSSAMDIRTLDGATNTWTPDNIKKILFFIDSVGRSSSLVFILIILFFSNIYKDSRIKEKNKNLNRNALKGFMIL